MHTPMRGYYFIEIFPCNVMITVFVIIFVFSELEVLTRESLAVNECTGIILKAVK